MKWLAALLAGYPARSASLVTLLVTVGVLIGHPVSGGTATAIVGAVGTLLSFLVHSFVTPTAKLPPAVQAYVKGDVPAVAPTVPPVITSSPPATPATPASSSPRANPDGP